ncbi:MAG: hypothetical protein L0228_00480 [Planctomycetes bacterium]|nr:hypothetical protein [Planctomycetota bacterium]
MPHYDRHADVSAEQNDFIESPSDDTDQAAMEDAAEALRQVEVEAVQDEPNVSTLDASQLDFMSIDELRAVAKQLDVPDRA